MDAELLFSFSVTIRISVLLKHVYNQQLAIDVATVIGIALWPTCGAVVVCSTTFENFLFLYLLWCTRPNPMMRFSHSSIGRSCFHVGFLWARDMRLVAIWLRQLGYFTK